MSKDQGSRYPATYGSTPIGEWSLRIFLIKLGLEDKTDEILSKLSEDEAYKAAIKWAFQQLS